MREVYCPNCGKPTLHRNSILARMIHRQSTIQYAETYINYACPYCKHLTQAHVPAETKVFSEVGREFPADLTIYVLSLRCAKSDCKSRVVLLALVKAGLPEEELTSLMNSQWRNH